MWRRAFRAALKYLIQRKQLQSGGGYHWRGLPRGARSTDRTAVRREAGGCFGKGGERTGAHGWGRNKKSHGRGQPGKIAKFDDLKCRFGGCSVNLRGKLGITLGPDPSTRFQQTQTHLT